MAKKINFSDLKNLFFDYLKDGTDLSFEEFLTTNNVLDENKNFNSKVIKSYGNFADAEYKLDSKIVGKYSSFLAFIKNNRDIVVDKNNKISEFVDFVKNSEFADELGEQAESVDNSFYKTKHARKHGSLMKKAGIPTGVVALVSGAFTGLAAGLGMAAGSLPFVGSTPWITLGSIATTSIAGAGVGVGISQIVTNGLPRNFYNLRYGRKKTFGQLQDLEENETLTEEKYNELGIAKLISKFQNSNKKKFGKHKSTNRDRLHEIINVYNAINSGKVEISDNNKNFLLGKIGNFIVDLCKQDQKAVKSKKSNTYAYADIVTKGLLKNKKDKFNRESLKQVWDNLMECPSVYFGDGFVPATESAPKLDDSKKPSTFNPEIHKEEEDEIVNEIVNTTTPEITPQPEQISETDEEDDEEEEIISEEDETKPATDNLVKAAAGRNDDAYALYLNYGGRRNKAEDKDRVIAEILAKADELGTSPNVAAQIIGKNERAIDQRQESLREESLNDAYDKYVTELGGLKTDIKDKEAIKKAIKLLANKEGKSFLYGAKMLVEKEKKEVSVKEKAIQDEEERKNAAREEYLENAYTHYYLTHGGLRNMPKSEEAVKADILKILSKQPETSYIYDYTKFNQAALKLVKAEEKQKNLVEDAYNFYVHRGGSKTDDAQKKDVMLKIVEKANGSYAYNGAVMELLEEEKNVANVNPVEEEKKSEEQIALNGQVSEQVNEVEQEQLSKEDAYKIYKEKGGKKIRSATRLWEEFEKSSKTSDFTFEEFIVTRVDEEKSAAPTTPETPSMVKLCSSIRKLHNSGAITSTVIEELGIDLNNLLRFLDEAIENNKMPSRASKKNKEAYADFDKLVKGIHNEVLSDLTKNSNI